MQITDSLETSNVLHYVCRNVAYSSLFTFGSATGAKQTTLSFQCPPVMSDKLKAVKTHLKLVECSVIYNAKWEK